jgi:superoxide reductase
MIEKHYIEWIELEIDGRSYRQFLQPGEEPTALFPGHNGPGTFRAYCNIHGMWKTA